MKPFLRSPLPVVSIVLIMFTVLSVTTVFLSAASLITNISSSVSELNKWELAGSKYGFFSLYYSPMERPTEYVSVDEGVKASKEVLERLSSDSRVSDYIVVQIINSYINYSDLSTVMDPSISRLIMSLASLSTVVLYGVKLSDLDISQDVFIGYVPVDLVNVTIDVISNETIITKVNLFDLLFDGLNYTVGDSRRLDDLLDGLHRIYCLEYHYFSQFSYSCVAQNPLSSLKAYVVYDSSTFEKVGLRHLDVVKNRFKTLNVSIDYYTLEVLVFIDLKTESYFNPASIQGSVENAGVVANDLRNSLNLVRLSNAPLREALSNYQVIETAFRVGSVTSVLPAFVALVVVLRPISEMLVLSVRRVFGLMRVRGISQAVVKKWFYGVLLLSLVSGFCLGLLISYLLAISYFRLYDPMLVLVDPTILAMLAILLAIELIILTRRISRVASGIPPSETLKTTLIPESLLEPMKMGGSGWFSVWVGLYFILTGITNYSATRLLTTSLVGASGSVNIALIVVLAIIAMFESLLRPFVPAIAAYGFIKLYIINHEKFWDFLHRYVLSKSSLALPSKSIALTVRRRIIPILVLLAFSTTVMTQSILYSDSMNSLIDSATRASVGSEFLLKKDLEIALPLNKTLREVLNTDSCVLSVLNKTYEGSSSILVFSVWSSVESNTWSYYSTIPLVVIPDPNLFLQNTYWFNEWSLRRDLSNSIREASSESKIVLVKDSTTLATSASIDLRNISVSLMRPHPHSSTVFSPEVIDVWSGFPGSPNMNLFGVPVLVAGDWILGVPNLTESLYLVRSGIDVNHTKLTIYVYSSSSSVVEELVSNEFTLVKSLEDLRNEPPVKIARSLMTSTGGSSETYLVFMLLSAGIAVVVAYVVALETGKTALLMRVRGLTPSGMLKLNCLYWFTIILTSVIVGVIVGLALGISDLNTYVSPTGLGASLTFLFSQLLGFKGLQLGLGVLRITVSPVLVLATLLTSTLLPLIPILTIQLVYRGQVRERFIEVR